MNFGVPGMVQAYMPQLLGWAINGYAPLMLVLGILAGARSYMYIYSRPARKTLQLVLNCVLSVMLC